VANVKPDLVGLDESVKTLSFAQQMMSVRNVATVNKVGVENSTLLQMKARHEECIRMLQEKAANDVRVVDADEENTQKGQLQKELAELNKRLLTKHSAEMTLEQMRQDLAQKFEEEKAGVAAAIKSEMTRYSSLHNLDSLRQSMAQQATELGASQEGLRYENEAHQAKVGGLRAEVQNTIQARRMAEEETRDLTIKLAALEERASIMKEREVELHQEREGITEETQRVRARMEAEVARLEAAEQELHRSREEEERRKQELAELRAAATKDEREVWEELERWRTREVELQKQALEINALADEERCRAEVQKLRTEAEGQEARAELHRQVERLRRQASTRAEQLGRVRQACERMKAEKVMLEEREQTMQLHSQAAIDQVRQRLEESHGRETELATIMKDMEAYVLRYHAD